MVNAASAGVAENSCASEGSWGSQPRNAAEPENAAQANSTMARVRAPAFNRTPCAASPRARSIGYRFENWNFIDVQDSNALKGMASVANRHDHVRLVYFPRIVEP